MLIEGTIRGSIIIDGARYDHDVAIMGGRVLKRENSFSFSKLDMQKLMAAKPEVIILGAGHNSRCAADSCAVVEAQVAGIEVIIEPTSSAAEDFNKLSRRKKVAAIFHVV